MITGRKTANAVGGKTARACDCCVRKRARWYCAADDAFLCQSCDASVHLANQLAGRHERVLLETASSKLFGSGISPPEPTWHQGLTRRARTPRPRTKYSLKLEGTNDVVNSSIPLVPEMGILEASSFDDEEEEFVYRVPVFDPFAAELCNASNEMSKSENLIMENKYNLDDLQGLDLPTDDMELLEFAADVESLLGKGLDDTSCGIDGLGLTSDGKEEDNANNIRNCFDENRVKVEDKVVKAILGFDLDTTKETLDWDFGFESTMMIREEKEEEEKKVIVGVREEHMMMTSSDHCKQEGMVRKSSKILRLNYEDVINAWANQGCPWTNGTRPEINSDGCWPDFIGAHWRGNNSSYGGIGGSDAGREARVSRYREKRRTRLFSKKIRYQVRKLNAEKRPRMKGRFVKRETFEEPPAASSFPP